MYTIQQKSRTYNHITATGKRALISRIKDDFDLDLWDYLHDFGKIGKQQKDLIYLFMEQRGIVEDGTCWDSIAKIYGKRLGITVFQPRLKVRTFARTNYYEYGKQRQVQESA